MNELELITKVEKITAEAKECGAMAERLALLWRSVADMFEAVSAEFWAKKEEEANDLRKN